MINSLDSSKVHDHDEISWQWERWKYVIPPSIDNYKLFFLFLFKSCLDRGKFPQE